MKVNQVREAFLVTGPVHSGKTTSVMSYFRTEKNISGLYAPVIDGKRFIYSIHNKTLIPLEAESGSKEENIIRTKNYIFSERSFDLARMNLLYALATETEWLVIDEVGILELRDSGYEPALAKIIKELQPNRKLVVVVREALLEEIKNKYSLSFISLP